MGKGEGEGAGTGKVKGAGDAAANSGTTAGDGAMGFTGSLGKSWRRGRDSNPGHRGYR